MAHAVIVHFFDFAGRFWKNEIRSLQPLFDLEGALGSAVTDAESGELDSNEIAIDGRDGTLYLDGPDARALYASISEILPASVVTRGGCAILGFGPPDADDVHIDRIDIP